jgi:hypothetical protein
MIALKRKQVIRWKPSKENLGGYVATYCNDILKLRAYPIKINHFMWEVRLNFGRMRLIGSGWEKTITDAREAARRFMNAKIPLV